LLDEALAAEWGIFAVMKVDWTALVTERQNDLRLSDFFNLPSQEDDLTASPRSGHGPGQDGGRFPGVFGQNASQASPGPATAQATDLALNRGAEIMVTTGDRAPFQEALTELAADLLGFESSVLDADRPLAEYGFDSLMAVSLRNRLSRVLNKSVPVTLAFERPSLAALTDWVSGCLNQERAEAEDGDNHADSQVLTAELNTDLTQGPDDGAERHIDQNADHGAADVTDHGRLLEEIDRLLGEV
jgi:aryl carrier-like protein